VFGYKYTREGGKDTEIGWVGENRTPGLYSVIVAFFRAELPPNKRRPDIATEGVGPAILSSGGKMFGLNQSQKNLE
jgi:hypothetical protein